MSEEAAQSPGRTIGLQGRQAVGLFQLAFLFAPPLSLLATTVAFAEEIAITNVQPEAASISIQVSFRFARQVVTVSV